MTYLTNLKLQICNRIRLGMDKSVHHTLYRPNECNYLSILGLMLTHWRRVTHICFGKLTIISSDNGLALKRRQAIIWTNDGILLIGTLGTDFSEILIEIQTSSLKKIRLKMSSAECCSFRVGLNVLIHVIETGLMCVASIHNLLPVIDCAQPLTSM